MPLVIPFNGWSIVGKSGVAQTVTNSTAQTTLATVTIPANAMGPNGILRVRTLWTYTNSANTKTLRLTLGGTVVMGVAATTTATAELDRMIQNRGVTNSQIVAVSNNAANFNLLTLAPLTATVDTSVSCDLAFTGQMAALAETITLERYSVELHRGA